MRVLSCYWKSGSSGNLIFKNRTGDLSSTTKANPEDLKSWPRFVLRVDHHMCEYLTSGKKTRIATLSTSLKVWIPLKVARGFTRGEFEIKPYNSDGKGNKGQDQLAIPVLRPADGRRAKDSGKKVTVIPVKKFRATG
ncbi:hypothetical protein SAY87_031654 [Trapa incisa]|uniref:Uncharacterized protein n=1 Tax=Trapa incisa TaxID=236973 RepID=A0AAN7QL65_9MYRT|nr:hypothetical protein SAY87_031654 [Trapa incisa]